MGNRTLRLLIASGGTGGHVFPGLALAERARQKQGAEVLFVGGTQGLEQEVVPRYGFPLKTLPARGLRGQNWAGRLRALWAAGQSIKKARGIIREFCPDLIVGIGGYASGPTVLAGWWEGVPCVLLEPNAKPGLTNRLLGHLAQRICVGFPETLSSFPPHKARYTGNPVRPSLCSQALKQQKSGEGPFYFRTPPPPWTLFVLGGSAGAHRLNLALPAALPYLKDLLPQMRVVHQTGSKEWAEVAKAYRQAGVEAEVNPFINDIGAVYSQAHLAVCRAGAITLAEIAVMGLPAILVPYPYATDDHQRANAEVLVRAGAAVMILDRELSGERLAQEIRFLIANPQRLPAMARAARSLGRPQATEEVLEESVRVLCRSCLT